MSFMVKDRNEDIGLEFYANVVNHRPGYYKSYVIGKYIDYNQKAKVIQSKALSNDLTNTSRCGKIMRWACQVRLLIS